MFTNAVAISPPAYNTNKRMSLTVHVAVGKCNLWGVMAFCRKLGRVRGIECPEKHCITYSEIHTAYAGPTGECAARQHANCETTASARLAHR